MPDSAAPAAVASVAAPAAPAAPVAAPAAPVAPVNSLLPEAVAPVAPVAPAAPVDPNSPDAWVLSEGVLGQGPRPDWFKKDKYKSVVEQAKAYPELEKRFGAFVGAPAEGKYEFAAPEGLTVDFDDKHPLVPNFTKWAAENQLGQKGYNELLGMLARYEEAQIPNMNAVRETLGVNADARINAVSQWAQVNLSPAQYNILRTAAGGAQAAEVLQLVEALIGKTRQVTLPPPGSDVPNGAAQGEAAIRAEQGKVGPDGKRLWDVDPKHRQKVEKLWADFYAAQRPQG